MLFQYAQLGSNTIRLVRFHSRSTSTDLQVSLEHQTKFFEQDVYYSVISYQTATEAERKGLTLNGRTRMIDPNAWDALQAAWKDHKDSDRFWLDAVCVNHADSPEVREQNKQLPSIYASADQVLLWLGSVSADADTDSALRRRAALYVAEATDRRALRAAKKLVVLSGEHRCTLELAQQVERLDGSL